MNTILKEIKWEFVPDNNAPEPDKEPAVLRPYLDFYGLARPPFTITPDPEFLFSSSTHKTVFEDILYGIEAGMGFILLIGEVGTGKTTLCRAILDKLEGKAETVYIINPSLSGLEIIEAILDDLGITYPLKASKKELVDYLNRFLLKTVHERPVVIIIDDAQTMTPEGLENLRLISNLETDKKKLLQIVLAGQPELQNILSRPELRQLRQRIAICCNLGLIKYAEMEQYISLRLFVAGSRGSVVFTSGAIKRIYHLSRGIPRLINIICDYTLMAGYVNNSQIIRKRDADRAIGELKNQSILEKRFLTSSYLTLSKKRVIYELGILFISILIFAVIHNGKIFSEKVIPAKPVKKAQTTVASLPSPVTKPLKGAKPVSNITENKIKAETVVINGKPALPEGNGSASDKAKKNYIIQLFSYKNMKDAENGGKALRETGIDAHWNSVHMSENGLWYRVYVGGFQTEKDAEAYIDEKGINDGVILLAPWTVIITADKAQKTIEEISLELNGKGYDCTIEKDKDGNPVLMLGAYINLERALRASQEIINLGYEAKPAER